MLAFGDYPYRAAELLLSSGHPERGQAVLTESQAIFVPVFRSHEQPQMGPVLVLSSSSLSSMLAAVVCLPLQLGPPSPLGTPLLLSLLTWPQW